MLRFCALCLAAVVGLGCAATTPTGRPTLNPTPNPTPKPALTSSAQPSSEIGCQQITGQIDMPTPTIEFLRGQSTAAVVGDFVALGDPYWNTPDGGEPSLASFRFGRAEIRTPVVLAFTKAIMGDANSVFHVVLGHEGKIGCVEFRGHVTPLLVPGARYIFWLIGSGDSRGIVSPDLPVLVYWPVDSANIVHTDFDGNVPLAELVALLSPSPSPSTPASVSPSPPTPS